MTIEERMGRGPIALLDSGLTEYLRSVGNEVDVASVRLSEGLHSEANALVDLQGLAHPQMQLVLRFEGEAEEAGTSPPLEVRLVAPDGEVLARVPVTMTVSRPESGERVRVDHILAFANVTFARPGRYALHVVLDDRTETAVPLRVEQVPLAH